MNSDILDTQQQRGNATSQIGEFSAEHGSKNQATMNLAMAELLQLFALVPRLFTTINALEEETKALRREIQATREVPKLIDIDGWLDVDGARKYLGGMSASTFDKYRYKTTPRIKGCPLDGKTLYKKSDLDNFVRLYKLKSSGLT